MGLAGTELKGLSSLWSSLVQVPSALCMVRSMASGMKVTADASNVFELVAGVVFDELAANEVAGLGARTGMALGSLAGNEFDELRARARNALDGLGINEFDDLEARAGVAFDGLAGNVSFTLGLLGSMVLAGLPTAVLKLEIARSSRRA